MEGQSLRGFVGQGMDGSRSRSARLLAVHDVGPGAGSISISEDVHAQIFSWGGGGGGQTGGSRSGAGGAALFKCVRLGRGQRIDYVVAGIAAAGVAGGDTIVSVPGSVALVARGGATLGGAGGLATGGDVNRAGASGIVADATNNGAGNAASPGGGAGGTGIYSPGTGAVSAGGGGAAGFADIGQFLAGGNGGNGGSSGAAGGIAAGGGSGQSNTGGAGGAGRLVIVLMRVAGV